VDILTAKGNIESGDMGAMKESVDFLKNEGTSEHIELLKQTKLKLPIYETVLLESIDAAVDAITARGINANQPQSAEPANQTSTIDLTKKPDAQFPETPAEPVNAPGANAAGGAGVEPDTNGYSKPNDFPQNEYLDKVKDIWEKGKSAAIKNATLIKMKSQLNTIKNDKIVQLKHLGETAHGCFIETGCGVAFIDESIANINDVDKKIARKQEDEKEIEESRAEGGFWNVVKSSISKFAGYTKIKLDISILQSNRESKLSALGQLIYDRLGDCEQVIARQTAIGDVLATIKDLDRQREEKESEITEISQSE